MGDSRDSWYERDKPEMKRCHHLLKERLNAGCFITRPGPTTVLSGRHGPGIRSVEGVALPVDDSTVEDMDYVVGV